MANQKSNEEYVAMAKPVGQDALQMILMRAPSWLGSAVAHGVLVMVLWQIQWEIGSAVEKKPVMASIKDDVVEQVEEVVEPEKPKMEYDTVPDTSESYDPTATGTANVDGSPDGSPDIEMDQANDNVPGFNVMEPDDAPPLAISKLALGEQGAVGHFHGIYGSRGGSGRRKSLMTRGGSPKSEKTVVDSFGWLARVQETDGHWDSVKWGANHNCDSAVTGLALLAFLGHGETDKEGKYRSNVYRALEWMEKKTAGTGSWGERYYTQGICTMAVCEAYGLTRNKRWGDMGQRALDVLIYNQNPNGGWDYTGNTARVDTSVSGWCVLALKSGVASGLKVPDSAIERVKKWLRESVNADYTTGYTKNPGAQGSSGGTAPMTAVATLARAFMGWSRDSREMQDALAFVARSGVQINNEYYLYYGTLCMFQAGGPLWDDWNKNFRDALIAKQVRGRGQEFDGSWDPDTTYGSHGGRVYTTAMAVFCLEIYYRFVMVLK